MANTTSSEIIQKGPIEINQQFFVPPNVIDVRQQSVSDFSEGQNQSADEVDDEIVDTDPGDVAYVGLAVVDSISVISQTVKTATGGTVTVDIIIEVPDQDGVTEYDVRVTKL